MLAFLLGFAILLNTVADHFLRPALDAFKHAEPHEKRHLAAYASLLLAILIVILVCGLILTFRAARFFFPRPLLKPQKTAYPDAWAEAARRLPTPPPEES